MVVFDLSEERFASYAYPEIHIWQTDDGTLLQQLRDANRARDMVFSPDSTYIAASLNKAPRSIRVWRVADGKQVSDTLVSAQPRTLA